MLCVLPSLFLETFGSEIRPQGVYASILRVIEDAAVSYKLLRLFFCHRRTYVTKFCISPRIFARYIFSGPAFRSQVQVDGVQEDTKGEPDPRRLRTTHWRGASLQPQAYRDRFQVPGDCESFRERDGSRTAVLCFVDVPRKPPHRHREDQAQRPRKLRRFLQRKGMPTVSVVVGGRIKKNVMHPELIPV